MKFKILSIFFILSFSLNIFSQVNDEQITKGNQIIADARKAIGAEKNLDSLQVSLKSTYEVAGAKWADGTEISVILPDKISYVYSTTTPFESVATSLWNGEKYKKLFESVSIDGRRILSDVTKPRDFSNLSKVTKDSKILENIKKVSETDPKEKLNNDLWNKVFPLILMHPLSPNAEFKYIGIAKAANGEANVVDTTSESGRLIRLLFDSKTNQLLLLIEKFKGFDGDYENNYYYSNREIVDKILIPKKIKVENKFTPTGKDTRITYQYIDVVEFKINPKFKPNFFDVN